MIDTLLEKNFLPDWLVRVGIRRLLAQRLRDEAARYDRATYVADLKTRALAEQTAAANEQHYEVPTRFYQLCLGPRLKYSGCLYPTGRESLTEAEEAMLALYAERAQLADGQRILELGCGWGSLCLANAEKFPHARITAISGPPSERGPPDGSRGPRTRRARCRARSAGRARSTPRSAGGAPRSR